MRAQANCVHFFGALVFDVGSEQLFGEHIAFEQERMILLQSIQCIFERAWHRGNFGQLLRAQVVDILVERLTGISTTWARRSWPKFRSEEHTSELQSRG